MNNRWVGGVWGVCLAAMVLVCVSCSQSTAPPDVGPFHAAAAQRHQESWAKYLGKPVELTNGIGLKLVLVPPGEFLMGAPDSEESRRENEGPQHRVRITRPFYLGMYEVTQAEYERVMGTNPSAFSSSGNRSEQVPGQDTSRFPVEQVSWNDAVEFCRKLTELPEERAAGRVYRLPTEAEWEFACRAGTTTPFHFGTQLNGSEANCDGWLPYGMEGGYNLGRPASVGSYEANGFGLYDMHGNVCEWCADWYDSAYYADSPLDDPQGPVKGTYRARRGGCWSSGASLCRASSRDWDSPARRGNVLGFRIASTVSSPSR